MKKYFRAGALAALALLLSAASFSCSSMSPQEETRIRLVVIAEYADSLTEEQKQTLMDVKFTSEEDLRAAAKALEEKNRASKNVMGSRDANIKRITADLRAAEEYFNLVKQAVEAVNRYKEGGSGSRSALEKEISSLFENASAMEKTAKERLLEAKGLIEKTPLNSEQRDDFIARRSILLENLPAHEALLADLKAEYETLGKKPGGK